MKINIYKKYIYVKIFLNIKFKPNNILNKSYKKDKETALHFFDSVLKYKL